MRRRHLQDVAIRNGFHLVNGLRCNAISLPDLQVDGLQGFAFPDAIDELARQQIDRLVLDVVILLRQDLTGLDVKDLADVLLGMGPDGFMSPRFGNGFDVGMTGHWELGTGNWKPEAGSWKP